MRVRQVLDQGWSLIPDGDVSAVPHGIVARGADGGIPATVPGSVHTDLLTAGLIPDPYLDRNESTLSWIGRTDWTYSATFEHARGDDPAARTDLVCDGLDTVATIRLNGTEVARTANMHRGYRFDVSGLLRDGANELVVAFAAPEPFAERQEEVLGARPGPNLASPAPFNAIRKMACNFGWDWGPVLITSGIWQPIALETWSGARLAAVRPQLGVDAAVGAESDRRTGRARVDVELERGNDADDAFRVTWKLAGDLTEDIVLPGDLQASTDRVITEVDPWWPHGHGEQHRYDLTVRLYRGHDDDQVLDSWTGKVAFRSVRLDTADDEIGSAFTLVVNDVPIFARGANWIPDDCFPSRVTPERYRSRIEQAKAANIDLVRVWGGGLYETDAFYDACDELGVLVWQDFLFACAAYSEDEPLRAEVEAEARYNVSRLMRHPSLVLWNGNNENIWGHEDWGWKDQLGGASWGAGYYFDLLPAIVADLDPTRPYWPGSPWSGSPELPPNDPDHGCTHMWDVWNQKDYIVYRDRVPRFAAEYGWQAPPTWRTLTDAVHDRNLSPSSPSMPTHQKAAGGDAKLTIGLAPHFPPPAGTDAWLWAMQLNQARAVEVGITHLRSHRGRSMGSVVWQLNDCWPVVSWAAVDGAGRRKPLWYAMRASYAPVLLTIQPRADDRRVVALVSELTDTLDARMRIERVDFDGEVLASAEVDVTLVGRGAVEVEVPVDVAEPGNPTAELLVARFGDERALWFFAADSELAYPSTPVSVSVDRRDDAAVELTVTASGLVRDLSVQVDRVGPGAEVDRALVDLLPGESAVFVVTGLAADADVSALSRWPVLCSANDLVTAPTATL